MATLVQAGACGAWGVAVPQRQGNAQRRRGGVRAEVDTSATTPTAAAVNLSIKKDVAKVVDTVQVGELAKPLTVYCRCWRSATFPLCDGSHDKHNKATGDNVGPLLLKK